MRERKKGSRGDRGLYRREGAEEGREGRKEDRGLQLGVKGPQRRQRA